MISYKYPFESGLISYMKEVIREDNPHTEYCANAKLLWYRGWETAKAAKGHYIDLIFDERDPKNSPFVEIEIFGSSVTIGKRFHLENGLTKLRISNLDIIMAGYTQAGKDLIKNEITSEEINNYINAG